MHPICVIEFILFIFVQPNPEDFKTPQKVRYHWGGEWEEFNPRFMEYRYNGGQHVDIITNPNVTLDGIRRMLVVEANFTIKGYCDIWTLEGFRRSLITSDRRLRIWWASTIPGPDGLIHLIGVFRPESSSLLQNIDSDSETEQDVTLEPYIPEG